MILKYFLIGLLFYLYHETNQCNSERFQGIKNRRYIPTFLLVIVSFLPTYWKRIKMVTYIATERPRVIFINKKFIKNLSVISRRYSRDDPIYYINLFVDPIVYTGNNVSIDIYFYEFQANRYHRTYVELHAKMCDFVESSTLFGDSLKKAMANQFDQKTCPFPPGPRYFANLTIPMKSIPDSFPYRQGRLYCNTSITNNGATSRLVDAFIDVEVKVTTGNKLINKKFN